jgi:uncharacterized membrane protein
MNIRSFISLIKRHWGRFVVFMLILPFLGNAQSPPPPPTPPPSPTGGLQNPIEADTFGELVQAIANAVIAIGIPLVAIFLIYAGFLFVTSGGNEQKLQQAKTTFYWALVGGVIVIGAFAIATAIVNFAVNLGSPSP